MVSNAERPARPLTCLCPLLIVGEVLRIPQLRHAESDRWDNLCLTERPVGPASPSRWIAHGIQPEEVGRPKSPRLRIAGSEAGLGTP